MYPAHLIYYRDGVGEGMRGLIMSTEIKLFSDILKVKISSAHDFPRITLIVVNKRINQRFFNQELGENQRLTNVPSGTIVNKGLVQNGGKDYPYDFFLVPQNTTQGCVTPTHFYVHYDSSKLPKEAVEKLTFALCHYYFNWAGPIKVPAPCMYAHKIAELYMFLNNGQAKMERNLLKRGQKSKVGGVIINNQDIHKLLHFL